MLDKKAFIQESAKLNLASLLRRSGATGASAADLANAAKALAEALWESMEQTTDGEKAPCGSYFVPVTNGRLLEFEMFEEAEKCAQEEHKRLLKRGLKNRPMIYHNGWSVCWESPEDKPPYYVANPVGRVSAFSTFKQAEEYALKERARTPKWPSGKFSISHNGVVIDRI